MSETEAAFAEGKIRSMNKIIYRYMENNGYKYIQKLTQFVTTLKSRRNCSIDLIPKNVTNTDFWSILYSKPLWEFWKSNIKSGDRVCILEYDLAFTKGYNPQCTKKVFNVVAISSRKPPTYTIKDEQAEIIRSKIYQNELIKGHSTLESLTLEMVSNASAQLLPDNTLSFLTNFLPEQVNVEDQGEVAYSEISYPSRYQNVTEEKFWFFDKQNFQSRQNSNIWKLVFTELRILLKQWPLSFKKDTITAKILSQLKCLEEHKKLRFTLQVKDVVLLFLVQIWNTFSEEILVMTLE